MPFLGKIERRLRSEDLLIQRANLFPGLFADGAGSIADRADFDGVAAFGE
jgi:hypothetical protein